MFSKKDNVTIEEAFIAGRSNVKVVNGFTDLREEDANGFENPVFEYTVFFRRETSRHYLRSRCICYPGPTFEVQRTIAARDPICNEWLQSYLHDSQFPFFALNDDATKSWNGPGLPNELISRDQLVTYIHKNFGQDYEITKHSMDDAIDQQVQHYNKDTNSTRIFCKVSERGGLIRPLCVIKPKK